MSESSAYWVVIPAAGFGVRMEVDIPKQYISVNGKTIIEYTIDCFLQREEVSKVVVAISEKDDQWPKLQISSNEKVITAPGGKERYHSVLNGLQTLSDKAKDNDWVLVHDAARPCLSQSVLDRLMIELRLHDVGGILALPCRDTMKRANDAGEIESTVERKQLWHAQTPQMFRYKLLCTALEKIVSDGIDVTDEAMAMELCGHKPKLVTGHPENIKLTHKDDFKSIETYLNKIN